jgi:hypothetical protein
MISDGFSNITGGIVIKKGSNKKELYDYEEMVKAMSISEFISYVNKYDTDKSFDSGKVAIRKGYISKYYAEWVRSTYLDLLSDSVNNDGEINTDLSEWLHKKIKNIDMNTVRGTWSRSESLIYMLHHIQPTIKNCYTCTVFSIYKTGSDKPTNYAYLYSRIVYEKNTDQYNDEAVLSRTYCVYHEYFCTGPDMVSCDGEYRNRFTNMATLEHVKLHYSNMWDDVEEYLRNRPKVKFNQNYYLADNIMDTQLKIFKDDVNAHRYAIYLYIVAWLSQGIITYLGLQDKQSNSTYSKNMFDIGDNAFIIHLIEIYGISKLKLFYWESGYVNLDITRKQKQPGWRYNPTVGQKIIPLHQEDSKHFGDIRYKPWREHYISKLVSDLFINLVCPGVPVFHDWFYINGVDKHIFDNPKLYGIMVLSDEAKNIILSSDYARRSTYYGVNPSLYGLNSSSAKNTTEEIIVYDKSILLISEYVGRTVYDIASLMKSKEYIKSIGSMFSNTKDFFKYMFDITYALLCMNTKLNIIHGDLHLNNTTIHHTSRTYIHGINHCKNDDLNVLYILDKNRYIFKNNGKIGTVIDFSRSFIITDGEEFLQLKQSQSARIIEYYIKLFPEFMKSHGDELTIMLTRNFEHVYKIFSAIDMYIHTDRLIKFTTKYKQLNTNKDVSLLIEKINGIAEHYLVNIMGDILTGVSDIESIPYPNYQIINKCFNDYLLTDQHIKNKNISIDDIFFYKNKLRYSLGEFDKLPPRIKYVKFKKSDSDESISIPTNPLFRIKLNTYYNIKTLQEK